MQLFVMRHGQASHQASADAERELTEQGHLEAKVMAKWLNKETLTFDNLYVSPYVRAQQTANTLLETLNFSPRVSTVNFITPSDQAGDVHDFIDGICHVEKPKGIMIVSHMPLVSYLVAELTVDKNAPIFQTAAIAQIDYDPKKMHGELVQLMSPYDLC